MKKGIITTIGVSAFFAITMIGCGEKFVPMTEEQINAKVEELYNAQKDAKLAEFKSACEAEVAAKAAAKLEELKNAATAAK
ncbi:MAG: hypothetical protein NZM35_10465 [Chitinophagales bacterium]|nr:hypothetical protein [Chitinophagales bacterium]MDW8419753.1 hypothetical protein [Chitinophagales bacterium]